MNTRMQLVPKEQPTLEAIVYTGDNREEVKAFLAEGRGKVIAEPGAQIHWNDGGGGDDLICVIAPGDWVVRGVTGYVWSASEDRIRQTYKIRRPSESSTPEGGEA